jgi:hypothetical protein
LHIGPPGIVKDGKPFLIHWDDVKQMDADITELFDAAQSTFNSNVSGVSEPNCDSSGACLVLPDAGDGTGIFGFRPMSVYFVVRAHVPQPIASTPNSLYNFFTKSEPYSGNPNLLKIDKEGPVAERLLGPANAQKDCTLKLGIAYADLLSNCVQVTGNQAIDTQNLNKLLGGRTHDLENYSFNVVGIDQNFQKNSGKGTVPPSFDGNGKPIIILDDDVPANDDLGNDWTFDVRAAGAVANDFDATGNLDLHGTGAVMREYAKMVQADLNKFLPLTQQHQLGDVNCMLPKRKFAPGVIDGCTGFESVVLPAPTDSTNAGINSISGGAGLGPYTSSYLKPGDPNILFCNDPITAIANGDLSTCNGTLASPGLSFWDGSLQRVIQVMGGGDIFNLPVEVRDRRYFFRMYALAFVKYLKAAGAAYNPTTNPSVQVTEAAISAVKVDLENTFFDVSEESAFEGFDKIEYIERSFVDSNNLPIDFEYGTDVKVGNQRTTEWYRRMDREEAAMYQSMQTLKTNPIGSENNLTVTNLFGNPILAAGWASYLCAKGADPNPQANCGGVPAWPAKDTNGAFLADRYRGVWDKTTWHQGDTNIKVLETYPNIQAAKVEIPNYDNPYDTTQQSPPTITVLVPWYPQQPTAGFTVPISGTRDKFVQTNTLDFSGVTTTISVDYTYVKVPDPNNPNNLVDSNKIHIVAFETRDFLGDVFVCQDPTTGEILQARMYTAAQSILDWLNTHPGAQDACDVVVRYSPYNNYIDYISSRANGVKLNITFGQGFGRVEDVTVFDPIVAQQQ